MKLISYLFSATLLLAGCTSDLAEGLQPESNAVKSDASTDYQEELFPQGDGATMLSTTTAKGVWQILEKFDKARALTMGETSITDAQFQEIKTFVDENLKAGNDYDTYCNIFSWIYKNMTYASDGMAYLNPYEVFVNKRCICQGYANLLKTMCLTQGIPCFIANGWLGTIGGHAWNYVYAGDKWIVSDPTNNMQFDAVNVTSYQSKLIPQRLDVTVFEDDNFAYNYQDNELNVQQVKPTPNAYVVVPWSVSGLRIGSFHPTTALPNNVTQLYIGKNIGSFGSEPASLSSFTPRLAEVFVDPKSTKLSSYKGVVYKGKSGTTPYYIPTAITRLELRAMKTMEKNVIVNLSHVEEIVIAEGTERIEAYAVENCPKLKTAYIPESVSYVDSKAFYRCGNVSIVRTPTGIKEVTK